MGSSATGSSPSRSARETKGWYWRARKLLSEEVLEHRLALTDEVIALLIHELKRQRSRKGEAVGRTSR
jgi:hypothetical protein